MTYNTRDIATADLHLIEDIEYHIDPRGLVHIDGEVYTLEQVDPELAERELRHAQARYNALCRRPRSRHAWSAIAMRLWNVMQGPANLAMLPKGSEKRRFIHDRQQDAQSRADFAARTGRAV